MCFRFLYAISIDNLNKPKVIYLLFSIKTNPILMEKLG